MAVSTATWTGSTPEMPGRADARAAAYVAAGFRRLAWQVIDLTGDEPRCRVRGLRYRLPAERTVSLPAALGLRDLGVPTLVRFTRRDREG